MIRHAPSNVQIATERSLQKQQPWPLEHIPGFEYSGELERGVLEHVVRPLCTDGWDAGRQFCL